MTRNVDRELEAVEFDLMILHYLGVDHVGHVHGPKHPLIREKLAEMDSIIQKVYNRLLSTPVGNPHLMLITGDHGMATVGGHGGDSVPEVTTPLIAISIGRGNRSVHPIWYENFNSKCGSFTLLVSVYYVKSSCLLHLLTKISAIHRRRSGTKRRISLDKMM